MPLPTNNRRMLPGCHGATEALGAAAAATRAPTVAGAALPAATALAALLPDGGRAAAGDGRDPDATVRAAATPAGRGAPVAVAAPRPA